MFAGPLHSFDKDDQLDFSPCGPTYSQKRKTEVKAIKGYISSVFCFELIVMNAKTQKQEQHIEILENVNR
jgi:hypothetical protein